ncbi:MAG: hypothetical protein ACFB5Z_01640 [Elainellaceae cyanobacterium]
MEKQTSNAKKTTAMTRLLQAAVLTLLLHFVAQLYPSALVRTSAAPQVNDTLLAWQLISDRSDAPAR